MIKTEKSIRWFIAFLMTFFMQWGMADAAVQRQDTLQVSLIHIDDSVNVVWNRNGLMFPNGHVAFDQLYRKLTVQASSADTPFHILHMGGSHVQAGIFSGRMRKNMAAFNDGQAVGRGVAFPFSMMGTNGPKDISYNSTGKWSRSRCIEESPSQTLGLAGAAVATSDSASTIVLNFDHPIESLLMLGATDKENPLFPVVIEDNDTLYPPLSSEVEGYEFLLSNPSSTCRLGFVGNAEASFSLRGFYPDFDSPNMVYSESGVNGAAVPSWLRCVKFQEELDLLYPDLVIFAIGINDANVLPTKFDPERFKNNYRTLIARIRKANPECTFLFVTNNDCKLRVGKSRGFNTNGPKVEQAFIDLAREYSGAVWNLFQVMGGYGSSAKWVRNGLMQSDYVHFTSKGYTLLGDLLFNAIVADYLNLDVYEKCESEVIAEEGDIFTEEMTD